VEAAPPRSIIGIATAERCVALARGVVFGTSILMMETELLLHTRALRLVDLLAVVALVYVVGTSALSVVGRERPGLQFPLLVADMLLVTGIIYSQGGVGTEYYLLYYIPILQASVRLNFRDAIATSVLASGLYAVVGLFGGPVVVPMSAQLRAVTFTASSMLMAMFFGLLSREARAHLRKSEEMSRLAQALARKNAELEDKSRELAEAQKSLLASERLAAIGELAASLGHELRNPLGVIRNAAYYLRTRLATDDSGVAEMLSLVDAEVCTCDRTIGALLDFARPDQATPEPIALSDFVETVLDRVPPPEGVSVQMEVPADLPPVLADRQQLGQVFGNIAGNAFDAMGGQGVLTVRATADGQDTVRIAWQDTGPGIGQDDLAKIFTPLYTTKAKGIGLGLVVCKRFVERQGGRLEVNSTAGEGATFTVILPQAKGE
jgi:signal transduction histidine kinase